MFVCDNTNKGEKDFSQITRKAQKEEDIPQWHGGHGEELQIKSVLQKLFVGDNTNKGAKIRASIGISEQMRY